MGSSTVMLRSNCIVIGIFCFCSHSMQLPASGYSSAPTHSSNLHGLGECRQLGEFLKRSKENQTFLSLCLTIRHICFACCKAELSQCEAFRNSPKTYRATPSSLQSSPSDYFYPTVTGSLHLSNFVPRGKKIDGKG